MNNDDFSMLPGESNSRLFAISKRTFYRPRAFVKTTDYSSGLFAYLAIDSLQHMVNKLTKTKLLFIVLSYIMPHYGKK